MTPHDLDDADALDRLLDAIERGESAVPPQFMDGPLPAGRGCWYRAGPGEQWWRMPFLDWVWLRLFGFEGQYARRTKA